MFNSWIQDKPLLKKIKTNTKSSCETNFWEGWQQISKEMAKWCLKRVYDKSRLSPQLYEKLPEKAGGRKFIGSSSKSLSLVVFSLICTSKYALTYYFHVLLWMEKRQLLKWHTRQKTRILQRQQKRSHYNEVFKKSGHLKHDLFTKWLT